MAKHMQPFNQDYAIYDGKRGAKDADALTYCKRDFDEKADVLCKAHAIFQPVARYFRQWKWGSDAIADFEQNLAEDADALWEGHAITKYAICVIVRRWVCRWRTGKTASVGIHSIEVQTFKSISVQL